LPVLSAGAEVLEYKPNQHIEAARCNFEAARGGLTFPRIGPVTAGIRSARASPRRGFSAIPANAAPKRFKRAESSRSFDDNRPAQVDPKPTIVSLKGDDRPCPRPCENT
jgi:hypothetical protein